MTDKPKKENFLRKYLDPASRLGEILFGLIMVLSVTLTAGLTVKEGKSGVRQLLVAALGCNIAWGIIDGIMYIMNCMAERSVQRASFRRFRALPTRTVRSTSSGMKSNLNWKPSPPRRIAKPSTAPS